MHFITKSNYLDYLEKSIIYYKLRISPVSFWISNIISYQNEAVLEQC